MAQPKFGGIVPRMAETLRPDTLACLKEELREDTDAFRRFSGLRLKHWRV